MAKTKNKVNRYIRGILLSLLMYLYIPVSAQSDTLSLSVDHSSDIITFRVPAKEKIKEYQDDNRFKYNEPQQGISLWDKIKFRIYDFLNNAFRVVSDSGVVGIILLLVILFLVCLIIFKALGIDYRKILGKKEMDIPEIDIYTENVHEMDFDTLISNALKNKNFRLVIRFLYLKNLKQLSDNELIDWKTNKTNYSYQHEISNTSLRHKFLETTLIFDYVWYGEFSLDESRFYDIQTRMTDFNKMIINER